MRHKWNGKAKRNFAVSCKRCDCVKEIIKGNATYFINDTVTDKAPKCQKNIPKTKTKYSIMARTVTKYLVQCKWPNKNSSYHFVSKDKMNILWIAMTGRKSLKRNPTLFNSTKEIKTAIKLTNEYAKAKKLNWPTDYIIFPITVNS